MEPESGAGEQWHIGQYIWWDCCLWVLQGFYESNTKHSAAKVKGNWPGIAYADVNASAVRSGRVKVLLSQVLWAFDASALDASPRTPEWRSVLLKPSDCNDFIVFTDVNSGKHCLCHCVIAFLTRRFETPFETKELESRASEEAVKMLEVARLCVENLRDLKIQPLIGKELHTFMKSVTQFHDVKTKACAVLSYWKTFLPERKK